MGEKKCSSSNSSSSSYTVSKTSFEPFEKMIDDALLPPRLYANNCKMQWEKWNIKI